MITIKTALAHSVVNMGHIRDERLTRALVAAIAVQFGGDSPQRFTSVFPYMPERQYEGIEAGIYCAVTAFAQQFNPEMSAARQTAEIQRYLKRAEREFT